MAAAESAGRRPTCGLRRCALALLLVAGATVAQAAVPDAPDPDAADSELPDAQEPILPIPAPTESDPLRLALGERLFGDPRLSRDRTRSCASCHDTRTNGASSNRRDKGVDGKDLWLNTPTVFNAALSFRLNWEGNMRSFEAQAEASLRSSTMESNVDEVVKRLGADDSVVRAFAEAYGHGPDRESLLDALATYERSLATPGSRFDRWLQGDARALSVEERQGYRLFKSFGCTSCHQGVNVGGNLFERHGIFRPLASPDPAILRVPSLRNVATTAPYFHDGSAATLADAVRQMGAAQLNKHLSDAEVGAIVSFLGTLTGTCRGAVVTAPPP